MKCKYEGFFNTKTEGSCIKYPTINTGSIKVKPGTCFENPSIEIIKPHISISDQKMAEEIAKSHTYSFKF